MKKISRRQFLKGSMMAGAYLAAGSAGALWKPRRAYAFAQSPNLKKFIQPLRNPLTGGIPLAASDGVRNWPALTATGIPVDASTGVLKWGAKTATHYTIGISEYRDQLHPQLTNGTRLWGYGQNGNYKHLGGIIVAKRDAPVQITFQNNLPDSNIVPVDTTIPGAKQAQNRTAVHLHGGLVPWISDGGPFDWWAPDGSHGDSFLNNKILNPSAAKLNEAEYYYPNGQGARLVWYHDHAFGITRTNAYAGIASGYVITDAYEALLSQAPYYIPGPLDPRTLYLIFQDKIFYDGTNDPSYPVKGAQPGDLWYAHTYEADRWQISGGVPPDPSVIPEFFGDTILVNGTVYPYVEVEQRQYRLRALNACNARFLNPRLYYADSTRHRCEYAEARARLCPDRQRGRLPALPRVFQHGGAETAPDGTGGEG